MADPLGATLGGTLQGTMPLQATLLGPVDRSLAYRRVKSLGSGAYGCEKVEFVYNAFESETEDFSQSALQFF